MSPDVDEGEPFVEPGSIVRRIWGDVDLVLLVFGAAAAEFALNRAVDWLFVTRELPRDPIGRFLTTAAYAQRIALGDRSEAQLAFATIRAAHERVEQRRGERIPDWAHRDVLYLLIDHSERAFQALHRPLTVPEKRELYDVFRRVGEGLAISQLPGSYDEWRADRERHLSEDLALTSYTSELYAVYERELGWWRYALLLQVQAVMAPERVRQLLSLAKRPWIRPLLPLYGVLSRLSLRSVVQRLLIPPRHLDAVRSLERKAAAT